ncbi:MAG: MarR family winged helix-turn-helix transcriptional regulator [Cetobacterium sp.]|uniref:MarR family winged helix-turn-helix transcriptional regulator n=1 Tax=Cetobacterium TaxID=180162 RepID=UPI001F05A57F|nr:MULTISPECIES: helix-turn-helix domain-containing protein [Cetobacterium]MCX3067482.1 helix-turn-helix domain-containing protein [Cetobacterium somerae]UPO96960.1 MarR family transcriptional regulator [Cetobacterium somerae]
MNKIKIPVLISRISKLQRKILNEKLKDFNLEASQGIILFKIKELGESTPKELIEMGIIEKPAISKTLAKLEKLGYIEKIPSLKDARSFSVRLAKNGEMIESCVNDFIEDLNNKFKMILNNNSLKELETLLVFLENESIKK